MLRLRQQHQREHHTARAQTVGDDVDITLAKAIHHVSQHLAQRINAPVKICFVMRVIRYRTIRWPAEQHKPAFQPQRFLEYQRSSASSLEADIEAVHIQYRGVPVGCFLHTLPEVIDR